MRLQTPADEAYQFGALFPNWLLRSAIRPPRYRSIVTVRISGITICINWGLTVERTMKWFYGFEAHRRSLAKAATWRMAGSIDTFVISFIITGRLVLAGSIAATELMTKIALYYLHERIWAIIPWGRQ
jgi:uncharacterized membrane protein